MNKKNIIPVLIMLMAASLVGIIAAQFYWIKETFWLTQRRMDTEVLDIMKAAILKTENDQTSLFVAQQMGIDPNKPGSFVQKKDSLVRLKYLVDSIELALAEAELNQKINGRSMASTVAYRPKETQTIASVSAPKAKSLAKEPEKPQVMTVQMGTPEERPQQFQYLFSGPGESRLGFFQGVPAFQPNVPTPMAYTVDMNGATLTNGQILVLPDGKKVKVNVEPYIKTRIGITAGNGEYSQSVQELSLYDALDRKPTGADLAMMEQMPAMWAQRMDSLVRTNGISSSGFVAHEQAEHGRQRHRASVNRYSSQVANMATTMRPLKVYTVVANELNKRRRKLRQTMNHLSGGNKNLLRYVDSLSHKQWELAMEASRLADSTLNQPFRIGAPDVVIQNDVLNVAMADMSTKSVAVAPEVPIAPPPPPLAKEAPAKPVARPANRRDCSPVYCGVDTKPTASYKLGTVSYALGQLINKVAMAESPTTRVDMNKLGTALAAGFKEHNLDVAFEYAIVDSRANETKPQLASLGYDAHEVGQSYKASLVPTDLRNSLFLSVYIPDHDSWALYDLRWSLAASIIFTLLISGVFIAGILTIVRQKRLSVIKSDFISNMTHELKTPLATISLAADTINNRMILDDPDRIKYFTGIIKEENQRMNGHIERVLQMALLDKEEFRLKKTEFNLVELALEQGECLSLAVANRGGELTVDFDETELPILADKLQIQSLISNLVDNALKYCTRTPAISIALKAKDGMAVMTIQDNGIGISAKAQKRIFDRFYRVTQGDLHEVKGFGLGLSFVKAIAQAHGGDVEVTSKVNEGSAFTIWLPLIQPNNTPSA